MRKIIYTIFSYTSSIFKTHLLMFTSMILIVFSVNNFWSQKDDVLSEVGFFGSNPGNLKMFMHAPKQNDSIKKPMVVVLHGCGENANAVAKLTGWNKLGDLNNFYLVYPQQKISNNPNLCFNWFNKKDIEKGVGECESIFQMIEFSIKYWNIDTSKIFITGLSAGAAMSVVMCATHPELFKSAAIFAGGAYKIAVGIKESTKMMLGNKEITQEELVQNIRAQNPEYTGKYPQMIIYQGLKDPIVDPQNADFLVRQWTGIHTIDTICDKLEYRYQNFEDITRMEYQDAKGNPKVTLYSLSNFRHQLPIKPGEAAKEGGQTGIFGKDIGFHSTYQTALEFGIVKKL